MPGTREIVESKEAKSPQTPPVEKFKDHLAEIKKNLEEQVRLLGKDDRSIAVVKTFIFLTDEKSELYNNKTYDSLDEIHKIFKLIAKSFKDKCWALGVAETHKQLFDAFNLLLDWHKIKAIEAFLLHKPLASEINGFPQQESKISLREKFAILTKKINNFNVSLVEREHALNNIVITLPSVSETKLSNFLQPLIREENNQSTRFFLFYPLDKFKTEKEDLEKSTESLREELKKTIDDFKKTLDKQEEERANLYDSKLEVDVFYLENFAIKKPQVMEAYRNILNKEKTEIGRFATMSEWIEKMSEPYRIFQSTLNKSKSENTSGGFATWWDPYYKIVNNLYTFLEKELKSLNSPVFDLEKKHEKMITHVRNDLRIAENKTLEDFRKAARDFLKKIRNNRELVSKLCQKAEIAKENVIQKFEKSLQPDEPLPAIKPIKYDSIRRELLDKYWRLALDALLKQELQKISAALTKIKQQHSTSNLEELNKLESALNVDFRKAIDYEIRNCQAASTLVSDAFLAANNHHVMKDLHLYRQRLESRDVAHDTELASENSRDEKWYSVLMDKPWKKSVIAGLAVFVIVALAFTGWGLAVEASMSMFLIGTLGLSSSVGAFGGFLSYMFQKSCSDDNPDTGGIELSTLPSSKFIQPSVKSPILLPTKPVDHKPVIPLLSQGEIQTLGSWGFLGRQLARQDVKPKTNRTSLESTASIKR